MFEYINGKISEITPTYVVLEASGVGYFINISLYSYTEIQKLTECRIYLHQVIREDAHVLFGFYSKSEREIFRQLISVSGIGANTARMMLSSLSPYEIQHAIVEENVNILKNIKGIGAKSAERIIVDLKDKIGKVSEEHEIFTLKDNTIEEEALSALVLLGFNKNAVKKAIQKILTQDRSLSVEEVIKAALKIL
jgi:holliday junction DNA helicase RuvA